MIKTAFWLLIGLVSVIQSRLAFADSPLDDIFMNERETRRYATFSEHSYALKLNGCAGFLIGPKIGASAAHCYQTGEITSGPAMRTGKTPDGKIGRTYELGSYREYDYWVFEIDWNSGQAPEGIEVVPLMQIRKDDLRTGENAFADRIYTLGFPADVSHGRLIHSWGYGKTDGTEKDTPRWIVNNISLINGNSGGGIFRESDRMLVSVVSGGPHRFGQTGWKENDWNDKTHWNWGPAMYQVYEKSAIFQAVFINGHNRFLNGVWRFDQFSPAQSILRRVGQF